VDEDHGEMLVRYDEEPCDVLGVGSHRIELSHEEPRIVIGDTRDKFKKCARSWKRRPDVGSDSAYPDLSKRDAAVMKTLTAE
jgi:hypothetical protein